MYRGVTFRFDIRQIDFTGGAQQPLTVLGIRGGEKIKQGSSVRVGEPDTSWLWTVFTLRKAR